MSLSAQGAGAAEMARRVTPVARMRRRADWRLAGN